MSTFKPTTLIEEAQILFSTMQRFPTVLHFISARTRPNHTFISRSSSTYLTKQFVMVFGIGKMGFQRIIKKERAAKDCSKALSLPQQGRDVARAKMFVTPERLPPTASDCEFHSLQTQ